MTMLICLIVILSFANIEKTVYSFRQSNTQRSTAEKIPCVVCENSNHSEHIEWNLLKSLDRIFSTVSKADLKRETGRYEEHEISRRKERKGENISENIDHTEVKMFTAIPGNVTIPSLSLGYNNSLTVVNITDQFKINQDIPWPVKKEAVLEGDLVLGGLMMVHEREDTITCGPIMPQGGIQALEAMLYTLDRVNSRNTPLLPNITLGAHILDDCDKDTYGLEIAVDFIKGRIEI